MRRCVLRFTLMLLLVIAIERHGRYLATPYNNDEIRMPNDEAIELVLRWADHSCAPFLWL